MQEIKIFITYKTRKKIIRSNILTPIQTGRVLSSDKFTEMIGDDSGSNISELNNTFCEFTAIYWAWKNYQSIGNPGFIGFMQYRRCLILNDDYPIVKNKLCFEGLLNLSSYFDFDKMGLNDQNITKYVRKYKNIVPKKMYFPESLSEQYKHNHYGKDLDTLIGVYGELHPEDVSHFIKYLNQNSCVFFNIFILEKNNFFKYCEWIFPILFKLNKLIDVSTYSDYQSRAVAFLAERLTSYYLDKEGFKENYLAFCQDYDLPDLPFKQDNNIPIVFVSSNLYVPYLCVAIESLYQNASQEYNYDIFIISKDITEQNIQIIQAKFKKNNFRITFKKPAYDYSNFFVNQHFTIETFFRFSIPEILSKYDKCIYLDSDIIICDSLVDLFNIDVTNNLIGAAKCSMMQLLAENSDHFKNHVFSILRMHSYESYIQNGMWLLNLKKAREISFSKRVIQDLKEHKYDFLDQDATSVFLSTDEGLLKVINGKWNYEIWQDSYNWCKKISPELKDYRDYCRSHAKIIHFASAVKPWDDPNQEFAYLWWKYAKDSIFYTNIIYRMISNIYSKFSTATLSNSNNTQQVITYNKRRVKGFKFLKIWLKYKLYSALSKITFSRPKIYFKKKKDKYRRKYTNIYLIN